jgi:hypothetical protein
VVQTGKLETAAIKATALILPFTAFSVIACSTFPNSPAFGRSPSVFAD